MASQTNISGADSGNFLQLGNAPSGQISDVVLDVYSQEIMFQAQPVLRFEQIAEVKSELGLNPGARIAFLLYNSLTGDSAIDETADIETDAMSTNIRYISVREHAKAVRVSELLLRQAVTDVLADAAILLGMHDAKQRDMLVREPLLFSGNVLYADASTAMGNADRASIAAADTLSMKEVREVVELLATNKAPKLGGGDAYVAFVHPHQGASIRGSAGWVDVVRYGDPSRVYNGEIGRLEDVRFIETTMTRVIKARTGTSGTFVSQVWSDGAQETWADGSGKTFSNAAQATHPNYGSLADSALPTIDVYQGVVVGAHAVGIAEALPVEMRDNGVEDFGRKHSLAYYGIWGAGLIETGHSYVVETA